MADYTSNPFKAMLVAEIGSVTTRVTLVDTIESDVRRSTTGVANGATGGQPASSELIRIRETRLIAQAEVPSTVDLPYENPFIAIIEAASQISERSGRELLRGGELIMPQTNERDGVDALIALTSAAGPMALVVASVSSDVSAASALHAARPTYTTVLQTITLNETGEARGHDDWIEHQVQRLAELTPDAVIISGGLEQGAVDSLSRLAHIVGLTATATRSQAAGQQDVALRPVLFSGNSQAGDRVIEALSGKTATKVLPNLRPTLTTEHLEPTRQELNRLYGERVLTRLPGFASLRRLSATPVRTGSDAASLMTRFIAERSSRADQPASSALTLDVGASNTALYLHSQGRFSPVVFGSVGVGYGLGSVLSERGLEAISRWLPFPIDAQALKHHLLNKMLRPVAPPVTVKDLLIDQAIAREAVALPLAALRDERPGAPYNVVMACGSVFAHAPHPGYVALMLLDALQPVVDGTNYLIRLHVDSLGLLPACGALAFEYPEAAATLFERDLLRNTPLATVVVPQSASHGSHDLVEAELKIVGGKTATIKVAYGSIGRLPLAQGQSAQLILKPSSNVRIGDNAAGAVVSTGPADIKGSALGVVIDMRGRPLRLPEDDTTRHRQIWGWLTALGVSSSVADGLDIAPEPQAVPIPSAPEPEPVPAPSVPPVSSATSEAESVPPAIENDLAQLRKTVAEEPKKRGFFRR